METRSLGFSGMSAAAQGVQLAANNIASVRPEDAQARRTDQAGVNNAGNEARPAQTQAPREQAVERETSAAQFDRDRDRNTEAANQLRDEQAYNANAAVIRTNSQALATGTVVDLKA